jgi:hypothetical protein
MADGDFSVANRFNLQGMVEDMFASGPSKYELTKPVPLLEQFLMKQTATPNPVLDANGYCIGVNVHWLKSGQGVSDMDFNGSSAPSLNCDLATGYEGEADRKIYTDNVFIGDVFQIADRDCDSLFSFQQKFQFHIDLLMSNALRALNGQVISLMDSNKQDNLDTEVAAGNVEANNGAWAENADGKTIELPDSDLLDPDALAVVDAVAANNHIRNNYSIYAGRYAWRNGYYNSQFTRFNDNERSDFASYQAHGLTVHDLETFDSTLGGKNFFVVDNASYLFWNRADNTPVPVQFDEDKWRFTLEHPTLRVMGPNGQMQPLRFEVVEQRVCSGRDGVTHHVMNHKFEVKLLGILDVAPAGVEGETGILKFKGVAAG